MRRGGGRTASVAVRAQDVRGERGQSRKFPADQNADSRDLIARFFIDLRRALRLTLPQAAYFVQAPTDAIEALELGQVEYLPPWPETSRIVMAYASMANIDARPVLQVIGGLMAELSRPQPVAPAARQAARNRGNFARTGSAIANGAKRLPMDAITQIRQRPQRTLYALSVPLTLLVLTMHSSVIDVVSKPFGSSVRWVSGYFQEHFAPVRDGLRYIEVDDPRSRRADKLQIGRGSY